MASLRRRAFAAAGFAALAVVLTGLGVTPAAAEEIAERDPYVSAGVGLGLFIYLPTLRAYARYALHDVSFEARFGLLAPSFATGDFLYDVAAGPRFHLLQRERVVGFVSPRAGVWDIGPKPQDEDQPKLSGTEVNGARRLLNPLATVVVGADFFVGKRWVFTPELGGGIVWGQRFANEEFGAVVPLVEINAQFGAVF